MKKIRESCESNGKKRILLKKTCKHTYFYLIDDQKGQIIFSKSTIKSKKSFQKDNIHIFAKEFSEKMKSFRIH